MRGAPNSHYDLCYINRCGEVTGKRIEHTYVPIGEWSCAHASIDAGDVLELAAGGSPWRRAEMMEASGTNRGGTADGSEPAVANEVHDMTYLVQGTRCFNEVLPPPVTAQAANEGWMICGTPKKLPKGIVHRQSDYMIPSRDRIAPVKALLPCMPTCTIILILYGLQINHATRFLFCKSITQRVSYFACRLPGFSWQGTLPKESMKSMCRPRERKRVELIRKYRHMSLK